MSKRLPCLITALAVISFIPAPPARADQSTEIMELKRTSAEQEETIKRQEQTIQQLLERMSQLEARVGQPPQAVSAPSQHVNLQEEELPAIAPGAAEKKFPILEWGGYIDVGYIDQAGEGSIASSSIKVNSRGDTLTTLGLDGDSSLLVNEINLDLNAHVSERSDVIISFDLLPRDLGLTTSRGTAASDDVDLNLAYFVYAPDLKPGPLVDALFGDLRLSLGKIESPMGFGYRLNKSPARVNISPAHMDVYTVGYPVGIRARGNLFQDKLKEFRNSIFTYNLVLANADPYVVSLGDGDIDDNNDRTIMGRLSYGLDALGGFFEMGTSLSHGGKMGQGDSGIDTQGFNVDTRLERGPLTLRAEFDYGDEDRSVLNTTLASGGFGVLFKGLYGEGFYEFSRPASLPKWFPLVSLTPYYRYDTRHRVHTPRVGDLFLIDVKRHTFALRYIPAPGNIFKAEYQVNREAWGTQVNDDMFLMSFIREF